MSTQDHQTFIFYFYLEWKVSLQVPLQGKGENLKEIKVGPTFVDGTGSGYSATCECHSPKEVEPVNLYILGQ